jgi:amino acid adenylation domain-containing protein
MSTIPEPEDPHNQVNQELSQCIGPRMEYFSATTFVQLFEEKVLVYGDRPAVVAENGQLTYAELNARANQLARHLRTLGAKAETLVGICIDRSLEMAVAIVATFKSGAAYLPIDPDYPIERLQWMLYDSDVSLVITNDALRQKLSRCSARLVAVDAEESLIAAHDSSNLESRPAPDHLAYVIYTSGSTGAPKGVMITHASLANYVLALHHELGIDSNDRYLHTASIAFSSSRRQLLLPLSQGARVVIANSDERKDPLALFQMIKRERVTVMDAVPSFWRSCTALLRTLPADERAQLLRNQLRLMLSASEQLLSDIPRTWSHEFGHPARHVHMFGQTETAGIVCLHEITAEEIASSTDVNVVPVGRPIANTEIYILDHEQQPVAPGSVGELYIGGEGVGRGYLHRPDLTATKFIPHPFKSDSRLYRSGDWARLRSDGQIECTGRHDSQIKIRGFRVELGEIQATLAAHPAVHENVIVASEGNGAEKRLVAFVKSAAPLTANSLRDYLSERLPDYMVPTSFVELNEFPLTPNGKVDRLALPEPPAVRPELTTPYRAPETAIEKSVAAIWSKVLRVDAPGVEDDFFHLGGHSLLAMQVIIRLNEELKISLPVKDIFEAPTIRGLAEKIRTKSARVSLKEIHPADRNVPIPLSYAQQRLWFLSQLEPNSALYNISRAFRLEGALDIDRLQQAVRAVVARHEVLRTTFVETDRGPLQVVAPELDLPLQMCNVPWLPGDEVERLIALEAERPFNLAVGPLLRVTVFVASDHEHVLLLSIHHAIADSWSVSLFFRDLAACYLDQQDRLPPLVVQYADYSAWQQKLPDTELWQQLTYWKNELANAPFVLELPTDQPRSVAQTSHGAKQTLSLGEHLSELVRQTSRQQGVTLFMLLMSAFQILLSLYSGQDDLLVGTPVAGRTMRETEELIGCFINTLVLRGNLSGNPSLCEVIKRTRETALHAYSHQELPFEKLVEELRPERSLSRTPIFQVMFVLQNETEPQLSLPRLTAIPLAAETATAKFDLTLGVTERPEGLDVWLSYSTDLFEAESAAAMLNDFKLLLETLVADCDQRLSDLPRLSWKPKAKFESDQLPSSVDAPLVKEFVAPRTPVELRLASIWREVLRVENVSVNDNFFELGGHSLLAAQVIARTRTSLSAELTLRRLFETPTIAGLAQAIYEMQTAATEDTELAAMLAEFELLSDEEAQQRVAGAL